MTRRLITHISRKIDQNKLNQDKTRQSVERYYFITRIQNHFGLTQLDLTSYFGRVTRFRAKIDQNLFVFRIELCNFPAKISNLGVWLLVLNHSNLVNIQ